MRRGFRAGPPSEGFETGTESYAIVIVGCGEAGAQTAVSLRSQGFSDSIAIVGAEPYEPYTRPPLSKEFLKTTPPVDDLLIRPSSFWKTSEVTLITGTEVVGVDAAAHRVRTDSGREIGYQRLVWAAGGRPRPLRVPGADAAAVHTLRTIDDANALRRLAGQAERMVVIGGGYIGLETAASLGELGIDVHIVEVQSRLLARVTCPPVSEYFRRLHTDAGVEITMDDGVEEVVTRDGVVTGVRLTSGRVLPADAVLVGIGLIPNVEVLREAGAACANGVDVDERGRTSLADVFAAGDCANFPSPHANARVRLESVHNAKEQGRIVADTILGVAYQGRTVPWFWSDQYTTKLKSAGINTGHDALVVRGDPDSGRFSVLYLKDGCVLAIDTVNMMRDFAHGKAIVGQGVALPADRLADPQVSLKDLAKDAPPA